MVWKIAMWVMAKGTRLIQLFRPVLLVKYKSRHFDSVWLSILALGIGKPDTEICCLLLIFDAHLGVIVLRLKLEAWRLNFHIVFVEIWYLTLNFLSLTHKMTQYTYSNFYWNLSVLNSMINNVCFFFLISVVWLEKHTGGASAKNRGLV